MTRNFFALTTLAIAISSGCSRQVYSPPSRLFALPQARTLGANQTSGSITGASQGAIFGPQVNSGEVGVRHGITDEFDVEASATLAAIGSEGYSGPASPTFGTARVGVKANPKRSFIAFFGGIGGASHPQAGRFFAVDVGAVLSYHNCIATPSLSVSAFGSNPIQSYTVPSGDDKEDFKAAKTSGGWMSTQGVALQLDRAACQRGKLGTTLTFGSQITQIANPDDTDVFMGLGLKLESSF